MNTEPEQVEADTEPIDFSARFRQQRLLKLNRTEAGLADRAWMLRKGDFHYVEGKGFVVWSATRWRWDMTGNEMRKLVRAAIRELHVESVKSYSSEMTPEEKKVKQDEWAYLLSGLCRSLPRSLAGPGYATDWLVSVL